MEIHVIVNGQSMRLAPASKQIVAGSQNFVKFVFHLDNDWMNVAQNVTNIFAQFVQGTSAYNIYLNSDSSVYLPPEIKAGRCTVMLYGVYNTVIATTNRLSLIIGDNGLISDISSTEITQTLYDQMVALVNSSCSGTPLVAHSASEMSDKTRIYVYIGSETGYTNGSWYYYNGQKWEQGGTYTGSSVEVASIAETLNYLNISD